MKKIQFVLPVAALAGAAMLLVPERAVGFSTIGGSLGLTQRDVRLFNNLTAAGANNNTAADADWPGYDGAELAFWKGAAEWASELHNLNGNGDSSQAGGLGSGGANFDPSWQGNATAVGGINENICSQIAGSSGGVLAFTETPISDGWRQRYYQNWSWQDGPGNVTSGIDLQGVMCHEYGHSLGLGHSTVGGTTMFPSISGTGQAQRSIAADDIAGVQFIYGVKSATKPHISSISQNAGILTINGSNFSATNNTVWFTKTGTGGNGDPIKVSGLTSNGSLLQVAIPATAGPGDVLVQNSGSGHANLSNAFGIDPNAGPQCNVLTYCSSKISTNLCIPTINSTGLPVASVSNPSAFVITTDNMERNTPALNFWSATGQASTPFQGAFLCVAAPVFRLPAQNTGGATTCLGQISNTLADILAHPQGPANVFPGALINCQTWGRDAGDVFGTSLSNGIEFTICP